MNASELAHWYVNTNATKWRTPTPLQSALGFHQAIDGYQPTELAELPSIAKELGVGQVYLKDESNRLGLPAFKILGASWAVCRRLSEWLDSDPLGMTVTALRTRIAAELSEPRDITLTTATDGNHGRAVARMAAALGVTARIYIPRGVGQSAIAAIASEGADVQILDCSYDDAVTHAYQSSLGQPLDFLIQDTSWSGYVDVPRWIVEGYGTLFTEIDQSLATRGLTADLVICPVGVGSLAEALVDYYRSGPIRPALLSVEPVTAACVAESLTVGRRVSVEITESSIMAGLSCGTPTESGWPTLQSGLSAAVSISDDETRLAMRDLTALGQDAGPCGAATLAGARAALADEGRMGSLNLDSDSVIVLISTEGTAANPLIL